jgi:predicted Zn-dependent protease
VKFTARVSLVAMAMTAILAQPLQAESNRKIEESKQRMKDSAFDYQPIDDDERGLWLQMDEEERSIKLSKFLVKDPALNEYVRKVLCKTVGELNCQATRIYIMRTPHFNASMAPNGMMIVWTGLLLRTRNEAELASVLGHEFSHFENLHSIQSFRDIRAKTDAMAWISVIAGSAGSLASLGLLGLVFDFSRDMEREADILALDHLVDGGYDPMASSAIWEQLRAEMDATAAERKVRSRKDKNDGFFSTHPNTGDRMEYLRDAASKKDREGKSLGADEYRAALLSWWPRLIDDQIKLNDFGATEFLLGKLADDGWTPELLYARGELYRARGKDDDFQKAVEFYRQSIASGAQFSENWRGLGLSLLRSGVKEEGQAALRDYVTRQPDAPDKAMISMMAGGS